MRAHRSVPLLLLATAFGLALSGCYTRARGSATFTVNYSVPSEVVVQTAPPPLRPAVTVRPAPPTTDAIWVEGHYKWEGRWVWVDGHWERNRPGYVWVQPVATRRGGRVVYHPGHWRPAGQPPPPVYRDPGPVRVAVRRPPPSSGGVVHARTPDQGSTGGTVRVRTPDQGTTTARRPPPAQGTTTARRPPPAQGTTTARRPPPSRGEVNRADDSVARAVPPSTARGEQSGATVRRPTVTARGEQGGTTTRHPSQDPRAEQGGATVHRPPPSTARGEQGGQAPTRHPSQTPRADQGGSAPGPAGRPRVDARTPSGPGQVTDRAFACSIDTPRAPEGGLITVTGAFGSRARVQIGGQFAAVVNRGQGRMRVRIPGSSGGGMVRVIEGGRSANCGSIEVGSR